MAKEIYLEHRADGGGIVEGIVRHPIELGEIQPMAKGRYTYQGWQFVDPQKKLQMDGAVFDMLPGVPSNTALITGNIECEDLNLAGSGSALILLPKSPELRLHVFQVGHQTRIRYGVGTVITYFSGDLGLQLLGRYTPPYGDGKGIEVVADQFGQEKLGERWIPNTYWEMYRRILSGLLI